MSINPGPITDGVDFNFFQKVIVTNTTFGVGADGYAADVLILLRGNVIGFTLVNEGSEVVEYSFNGNTLHGDMTPVYILQ